MLVRLGGQARRTENRQRPGGRYRHPLMGDIWRAETVPLTLGENGPLFLP